MCHKQNNIKRNAWNTNPKNGKQALGFDKHFQNTKWRDAIKKEIATMVEFNVFKSIKNDPNFQQKMDGNLNHSTGYTR